MENTKISNWVRQARHRAKKHNVHNDLNINDIHIIINDGNGKCAYCKSTPLCSLDHPFPIKDNAPNVPANVIAICKRCKEIKKNNDLNWMLSTKHLTESEYMDLLKQLLIKRGNMYIKMHIKKISGLDVFE